MLYSKLRLDSCLGKDPSKCGRRRTDLGLHSRPKANLCTLLRVHHSAEEEVVRSGYDQQTFIGLYVPS